MNEAKRFSSTEHEMEWVQTFFTQSHNGSTVERTVSPHTRAGYQRDDRGSATEYLRPGGGGGVDWDMELFSCLLT
ncbi:hypothetical protein E2C01_041546 [Portunus trituberculatus]|uniref:Uncharacterized protein n=1 Tax=Portunus trituberculatus TaxID=210409 RepID=A0A5B7FR81_PORTR|nr:hypothetical protein [Portunus trituberculatus]